MFIGGSLGVAATLLAFAVIYRDPTPPLTDPIFNAAHERWKSAAPADYDIEVRVSGPQAATYRVQVRGGQPQAAWRNGEPLQRRPDLRHLERAGHVQHDQPRPGIDQRRAEGRAMPGAPS